MTFYLAQVFGWIATILFSLMIIPQVLKTLKTKDTSGVSLLLFLVYLVANIVALIYAFMIGQLPLIIKYEIGILATIFYLTIYYVYSKKNF